MDDIWGGGLGASLEVKSVERKVEQCAGTVDEILDGFHAIQMVDWQSPAGRAYRDAVSLQAVAVRRAVERIRDAAAAVAAHATAALTSDCSPGGRF